MNQAFFEWLEKDLQATPALDWNELRPQSTAILVIDLVRGFCHQGPLASPRVEALVEPVARFLKQARDRGVEHIWFCGDAHPPNSPEFDSFPPHCLEGTSEAELHPSLAALDLGARHFPKRSLNAFEGTGLQEYVDRLDPSVNNFVLVGDCTDLCVYSAAMHLRLSANAQGLDRRVVVVSDLVDTYDLPVEVATSIGAVPHPGDLCHSMGLYQLRLNGCLLRTGRV